MGYEDDTARRNRNRSWWEQRTRMERRSIVFLVIAAILIIALIIALVIVAVKRKSSLEDEVCVNTSCVQEAGRLLKSMDTSIDPCDNFYDFACGRYIAETVIPEDKLTVGAIPDLQYFLQQQLRSVLEEPSPYDNIRPFSLPKTFYSSCMDTERLEDTSAIEELMKDLGGWPVLNRNWNSNTFDWKESVYISRRYGLPLNTFIKIDAKPDMGNASRIAIYLDQPELDITKELLDAGYEQPVMREYFNYMVDKAVLFGAEKVVAEHDVRNVIDFRKKLSNILLPPSERYDESLLYHSMTISELQQNHPIVPWLSYLNHVIDLPDVIVTEDQVVSVNVPRYFENIGDLLDRADKRVLANHVIYEALRSLDLYLPKDRRDRHEKYMTVIGSAVSRRWTECITKTSDAFPIALGALFVRTYFEEDVRLTAVSMIKDIKDSFLKIVKETKWMDETTRAKAVEKAMAMESNVGYPVELLDDKNLEEYYADLELNSDNMIRVSANATRFVKDNEIRRLVHPVNKTDWRTRIPSITFNAGYEPVENSITLTAGILQPPVFSKNRLHSMNYGSMGFFIGHEITHGYDNQGRKYDKQGDLVDWWAKETGDEYDKKANCIIQQYSNFTVDRIGIQVNGVITQGENIADNGGVKEAYIAYTDWVKRNGPEKKLPGLNYTAKQLFWISAASLWCSKETDAYLQYTLQDVHSPGRFRVIGTYSNSDFFASDFNCPVGSKMNPKHKCVVW